MVAFRKPKKVKKDKIRKRGKLLKADDLIPDEPAGGANNGSRDRGRRRRDEEQETKQEIKEEEEESMETEENPRWKKSMGGSVDINRLQKLVDQESDSDDEFGRVDLSSVVVDDDAGDELNAILEKTRRFKQAELKKETDTAQLVHKMLESYGGVKMEVDSEGEEVQTPAEDGVIRMDSTTEYCRNIGNFFFINTPIFFNLD